MMSANSFDLWTKDVFFSAAEEVQESADIMESVYRTWVRERREGLGPVYLDELRTDLHTSLGTTKWQLEEFERAVKSGRINGSSEDIIARHRQFVVAIGNQISRVETALRDSLIEEGKQPLRWVQLDEEERDDLAVFLSGNSRTSQDIKDEQVNLQSSKYALQVNKLHDTDIGVEGEIDVDVAHVPKCINGFKESVKINEDANYVIELAANELPRTGGKKQSQGERLNGQRRTWSSPDFGAWKIVIGDKEAQRKKAGVIPETPARIFNLCGLIRSVESTAKLKGPKNSIHKAKSGDHLQSKQGTSSYVDSKGIIRILGRVGGFQRRLQGSQYLMQFSCSLRVTFMLMLSIILAVPFVLYAT